MSKNAAIDIYLRVRPTKKKSEKFHLLDGDNKAIFTGLKQMKKGEYVNNTRNDYSFVFNDVFGMETKQEEVFERVAKDVIDSAFEGFNGTVFAYGQTGSGKTYTMIGSAERYSERGMIPRAISYIFAETARRTDSEFKISISFMEIYNNDGYDLLSEDHASKQLSDLPKVVPLERANGELVLSGLSTHRVPKEEDALNLLFIGDTNRVICETPMNDASTRSHCIFIVTIESNKIGSDIKNVSKVHLVDLSGSERVGKTGVGGELLKEACYINLSLHYLEQVINSLQKKMNAANPESYFVPYRNSLMTMVLRDSLGGNCKTKMISTIHVDEDYVDESISTCNFAMRVALIKNVIQKNELVDPNIIIQRLKRENQELKAEISLLRGGSVKSELTEEDEARCRNIVKEYLGARDPTQRIILTDPLMLDHCFREMKGLVLSRESEPREVVEQKTKIKEVVVQDTEKVRKLEDELVRLKLILKQRENEILIFLNLINKKNSVNSQIEQQAIEKKEVGEEPEPKTQRKKEADDNIASFRQTQELQFPSYSKKEEDLNYSMVYSVVNKNGELTDYRSGSGNAGWKKESVSKKTEEEINRQPSSKLKDIDNQYKKETAGQAYSQVSKEVAEVNQFLSNPLKITKEQLINRQECLEMFRMSYRKNEAQSENLDLLKSLTDKGKQKAEEMKQIKNDLDNLKSRIEGIRRTQALQGMKQGGEWVRSDEEEKLLHEVELRKTELKEAVDRVKLIKEEIMRVKVTYENGVKKMNKDFEKWLNVMMEEQGITTPKTSIQPTTTSNYRTGMSSIIDTKSNINTSMTSKNTAIRDDQVKKDYEAFMRAKEEISMKTSKYKDHTT